MGIFFSGRSNGLRTISCTSYSACPRDSQYSSGVIHPSASEILPALNHASHASSAAMNPSAVTPDQSPAWKNSCLSRPKNPSARALSQLMPFRDMLRTRPARSHMETRPGQR